MRRLVYDLGMHCGEDTAFYLRRGFEVVGVEANPRLVGMLRETFASELRTGQLRIVGKAINAHRGRARFRVSDVSVWGTLTEAFAQRNDAAGAAAEEVEVECVTFDDVLREHGMPYYLKMDIEGAETCCLDALHGFLDRPRYVSVESCATSPGCGFADTLRELRTLRALGYRMFRYRNQTTLPGRTVDLAGEGAPIRHTFAAHSSGPFGRDLDGRWRGLAGAAATGLLLRAIDDVCGQNGRLRGRRGTYRMGRLRAQLTGRPEHWYDLHASLAEHDM
jgi:FkbM family methyltransferase